MGGQHARSSVRGGRRAALSRGIGGRRPGPPLVVRGAPSTGFRGRWQPVFTSEALLPGEPVVRCCSNSGAIPATRRHGGSLARTLRRVVARRENATRPRAASRPLRDRCRRTGDVHAMRGTCNTQVQLIHKGRLRRRRRRPRAVGVRPPPRRRRVLIASKRVELHAQVAHGALERRAVDVAVPQRVFYGLARN